MNKNALPRHYAVLERPVKGSPLVGLLRCPNVKLGLHSILHGLMIHSLGKAELIHFQLLTNLTEPV